ncbi:MAG: hypothetical protein ACQKBU_07945 [Verrucomicrobiales bacterium]
MSTVTITAVDTLKILLGATMALLIGALLVFANRMHDGVEQTAPEEVAAMRQQLFEMQQELERISLEKQRRTLRDAVETPGPSDLVTRGEAQETVIELEERLAELEEEAAELRNDAAVAESEAGLLTQRYTESRSKMQRRSRVINEALQIATIKEWVDDPTYGGFAVLSVERPDNVQSGTVLAIRRNGGILGTLRVGEVTFDGAIANPITSFAEVKPEPGDELILNEVVKLAD